MERRDRAGGIAAAQAILLSGVAALVAGAMSMAAGEYVSVHSQADTEKADLDRERAELSADPAAEARELTAIYVARGLTPELAQQVSAQLMAKEGVYATVKLPSGEMRMMHQNCKAAIGQVGNPDHENVSYGKAGRTRWLPTSPCSLLITSGHHPLACFRFLEIQPVVKTTKQQG